MPGSGGGSARTLQPTTRASQIVLPVEIWTIILDMTIHVPRLFVTTCTDESFVQYRVLGNRVYDIDEEAYHASERQRLILRNVCSAWRVWADSRKNRYIVATDTGIPLEVVLSAVRVPLLAISPNAVEIRHDQPSRWRIIDARIYFSSQAICFMYLSLHANKHPLLRRINLSLCPRMKEISEVIRCLVAFKHLTYLSFDTRRGALGRLRWRDLPLPKKNTSTPLCTVTLPNVRILEFLSDIHVPITSTFPPSDGSSPAFVLNLPQMEHFYFHGRHTGRRLEFEWLTPFALRGLKSLLIGVRDALDIEWSELPNLEELACRNFEPRLLGPPPNMHPLQQVWLFGPWSLEIFDTLTAGLEAGHGTNLRKVHLRKMRWWQGGKPIPGPREKQGGLAADDEAKDKFCDKVDRLEKMYGLKTLDYHGCTRDNAFWRSVE